MDLLRHYEELKRADPERGYDLRRLARMESLKPTQRFVGIDRFKGYVVLAFDVTEKVILENPRKGNAIYVLRGNWKELSKLTKGGAA